MGAFLKRLDLVVMFVAQSWSMFALFLSLYVPAFCLRENDMCYIAIQSRYCGTGIHLFLLRSAMQYRISLRVLWNLQSATLMTVETRHTTSIAQASQS